MKADVTGSPEYLAEAAALAARLHERGRSVFELHYSGLSFGSWTLLAGTPKRRVLVSWDGKERELSVQAAAFSDSQSRPAWTTVSRQRVEGFSPAAVLGLAEEQILVESGAPAA